MTLTTAFLATALFVPAMPPPEYDDCEVVTNCVFDASQGDAKMFAVKIGIDATPLNLYSLVECLTQRRRETESAEKSQKSERKERYDKKRPENFFHPIGENNYDAN